MLCLPTNFSCFKNKLLGESQDNALLWLMNTMCLFRPTSLMAAKGDPEKNEVPDQYLRIYHKAISTPGRTAGSF